MKTHSLIYIGRRIFDQMEGKIAYAFVKNLGNKRVYYWIVRPRGFLAIGDCIQVSRKKSGGYQMDLYPHVIKTVSLSDEQREDFETQDILAEAFEKRVKLAKRARTRAKTMALKFPYEFRQILKTMRSYEKRQFIDALVDELEKIEK